MGVERDESEHLNTPHSVSSFSSSGSMVSSPASRRMMMSDSQKRNLSDYLQKPIAYFDVYIDEGKKSFVWKYFGELAFKDPETGNISVLDNERHYCLKCIIDCQTLNPMQEFENSSVYFFSNITATGNHKNHLRVRHNILDETPKRPAKSTTTRSNKRLEDPSIPITICVEDVLHEGQQQQPTQSQQQSQTNRMT